MKLCQMITFIACQLMHELNHWIKYYLIIGVKRFFVFEIINRDMNKEVPLYLNSEVN